MRARELRLIHIPNRVVDPDHFVKLGAVAVNVKNGYLRPVRLLVHVEVIDGWNAFTIHNRHILGADCYEILDTYVGKIVFEKHERL